MGHGVGVEHVQRAPLAGRLSSRGRGDDVYTNPATDPGKLTGDSRIWDRLDDAVSYRNFGMWAGGPLPAKVFATERRG